MPLDDTELMLLVKEDGQESEEAFAELVHRHQDVLVGFFYRKARDHAEAHDRAQEVFLKLWISRHAYQPRASLRAYIFQIARNHWIDVIRARNVRPRMWTASASSYDEDAASPIELVPSRSASPDEEAEITEQRARVTRAVEKLPAGQRAVWELAEIEGLRYAEIGGILGIPVGTVKSRHHHAVRKLKEELLTAPAGNPGAESIEEEDQEDASAG